MTISQTDKKMARLVAQRWPTETCVISDGTTVSMYGLAGGCMSETCIRAHSTSVVLPQMLPFTPFISDLYFPIFLLTKKITVTLPQGSARRDFRARAILINIYSLILSLLSWQKTIWCTTCTQKNSTNGCIQRLTGFRISRENCSSNPASCVYIQAEQIDLDITQDFLDLEISDSSTLITSAFTFPYQKSTSTRLPLVKSRNAHVR